MKKIISLQTKQLLYLWLFVSGLLVMNTTHAQLYAPEGLNMPGTWNSWANPPATGSAFGGVQTSGGGITLIDAGVDYYQTIFNAAASGGDATGGAHTFVFSSGPTTNYWSNKWFRTSVTMNTLEAYTKTSGSENTSITLTNGKWYTMNYENKGYVNTNVIFMETSAEPITISSVSKSPASPSETDAVTVTITTSAAPSAEEKVYVRYTINNWTTSALALASFSGSTGTATIPAQAISTTVKFYVLTTTVTSPADNFDLYSIRFDNNAGNYFSYTVSGTGSFITLSDDGAINEGAEDNEVITVTLNNDNFENALTTANWTITNLPAGVSVASISRTDATHAAITLSGNATVDYDADITNVTVAVGHQELVTLSSGNVSAATGVTFNADVEASIVTPNGINIPGLWNGWTNVPSNNTALASPVQVNGGRVNFMDYGTDFYQTTLSVAASGGDVVGAVSTPFVFSHGTLASPWSAKWTGVTVALNTLQTYTYVTTGGVDNTVTITNGKWYTINFEDKLANAKGIFMETSAKPVDITDVQHSPATPDDDDVVTITVTTSGVPSAEEKVYLRYSTNTWGTSSVVPVVFTGNTGTAQISAQSVTTLVEYYVFTTTVSNPSADYDLVSIKINNNGGSNHSYTVVANTNPNITISDDGLIEEGSENGEVITVTLANDTFKPSLNAANWSITNLPAGVTKGAVNRVDATHATITLSGNATSDYDVDITNVTVTVTASELVASVNNLSASSGVTLVALYEGALPTIGLNDDGSINEGAETGEVITVTLSGGLNFVASLNAANWTISNLPAGVSKGAVNRISGTQVNITLSGNATEEYYCDIANVKVTVAGAEIQGYGGNPITSCSGVTMKNTGTPLITTNLRFPTVTDNLTITFDASQGNAALSLETGTVYAHTGVTVGTDNWQHSSTWGDNAVKYKLTSLGSKKYQLQLNNIKTYYGITAAEEANVKNLNFVFRNSTGTKVAKTADEEDIFIPIYSSGLNVILHTPITTPIVSAGSNVRVVAEANNADKLTLYVDNTEVYSTCGNRLSYTVTASATVGAHEIKVVAENATETVQTTGSYYTLSAVTVEALPNGVRNGINYIDDNTVTLVLHAPYKQNVFVVGDFNNWALNQTYFMKRTHSDYNNIDNKYWITITGLTANQEYAFQYLIDGSLQVSDPYAEKILDSNSDSYIRAATYPDLMSYPEKGENMVSVMHPGKPAYNWEVANFTREAQDKLVIYELHVRDYESSGIIGNLDAVRQKLDYLEGLGVNAIELMPFNEFDGNDSWGYNPLFYFATDKAYGTETDYKEFIDECHKRGIAVFMDMVLNHTYFASPMVEMYFDKANNRPAANNPWYNTQSNFENTVLSWGADFNHESVYTDDFVKRIMEHWLVNYKIDGFRFDFTKGFSNNWKAIATDEWGNIYDADRVRNLEQIYNWIKTYNSSALMICEHLASNDEESVMAGKGMIMWGNMEYNYAEVSFGNTSSGADLDWANYKARGWAYPNLIPYMESHDEERISAKLKKYSSFTLAQRMDRIAMSSSLYIPLKGPKMIWQFQELGYDTTINYNGRTGMKPVLWDYYNNADRFDLYQHFSILNNAKRKNDVFTTDNYTFDVKSANGNGQMKRLAMYHATNNVVIIANTSATVSGSIIPNFSNTGTWYDVFNGTTINVSNLSDAFLLQPGEFRMYSSSPLKLDAFWIGKGADNNWNTADNWNIGRAPASGDDVTIPANVTVNIPSGTNAVCTNLTVRAGGMLTVASGGSLTVSGTLTLNSDATGTASLVDLNTSGAITVTTATKVEKYLSANRWWYISSPVTSSTAVVFATTAQLGGNEKLYYENGGGVWNRITDETTSLNVMKGYAANSSTTKTITYTGTLNTGTKSITLNNNSFTLVGNPFPSAIDWGLTTDVVPSSWTTNGVSPTIWYRTKIGNGRGFAVYNRTDGAAINAGQRYIPAQQGFWVLSTSSGVTLSVGNNARLHNASPFYKNTQSQTSGIYLVVNNGDEALVSFNENATPAIDSYDSQKMLAEDLSQVYTVNNGKKMAINAYNAINGSLSVPVGVFVYQDTPQTISIKDYNNFDAAVSVYLEDKNTATMTNLRTGSYTFSQAAGLCDDRFVLHFTKSTTSMVDADNNSTHILVFAQQNTIYVSSNGDGNILVHDVTGRLVQSKAINNTLTALSVPQKGIYMVSVINADNIVSTQKVVIH